ncbi:amino acid ABC transporter permease [Sinorhizobium mexicanum]|uniref:Amino acid ABC transporter permease n=1 Tax=Sinorhizobium mexicanum TaxID=375549 RepID=A0A859QZP4_9HYPH|nr:amino acid ABC transporter permease [Sinorhizobium mexicanum]MBP1885042.1 general L-amino acid transport system permease protein [Sinorhizobium mexicanum]QLL64311.1 amino acid ABC transporter permease [Sinorhizobium mexicanum]
MSERNPAFVRGEMLPAREPPAGQTGLLKLLRENFFKDWLSALLTVMSLIVSVWFVCSVFPWLFDSVWYAHSLSECREILNGAEGACFAVIRDRWTQLLFGFYPPVQYWRPVLAFALMVVALAPILFPPVPRRLLRFSVVFPGLAYWLIWGGTLWLPVVVYGGFAVGAVLLRMTARLGAGLGAGLAIVSVLTWWFVAPGPVTTVLEQLLPLSLAPVASREMGGFLLSIVIGVTGISLSLPLGIVLALGRRSKMPLVKTISVVFIEFIRGVPLITLLFTASLLLNYFLPPGTNFDLILRVIIMVTLFATAYMAEVIRGGLAALPRGQYEAAEALGLDYWKAQRLVIMPQALKISIPGIVNSFIGLFKDTTLVVFIGLLDPIALSNSIRAATDWQGIYWELFIFIGALFFVFCFGMSRYSMHLERRLKTDHR